MKNIEELEKLVTGLRALKQEELMWVVGEALRGRAPEDANGNPEGPAWVRDESGAIVHAEGLAIATYLWTDLSGGQPEPPFVQLVATTPEDPMLPHFGYWESDVCEKCGVSYVGSKKYRDCPVCLEPVKLV